MANEIIEIQKSDGVGNALPVSRADMENLKQQRELLKEFVSSQMREAQFKNDKAADYGEGDYGIIPGTKKKSLLKPGAEKLLRLFGLGIRVRLIDKTLDVSPAGNFAMFTYGAEAYQLTTGRVIAECDGSANSHEKKYKERTVWKSGRSGVREAHQEQTPVADILNTLIKMAQKRAIVGVTILATGASDYFSQDMEEGEPHAAAAPQTSNPAPAASPAPVAQSGQAPACCGKPMMISKYLDEKFGDVAPYYCTSCKQKVARSV